MALKSYLMLGLPREFGSTEFDPQMQSQSSSDKAPEEPR